MLHKKSILLAATLGCLVTPSLVAHDDEEIDPGDACAAVAYAVPLKGIVIDGKLDDWPKDMIRYPLMNNWDPYGHTDVGGQLLRDNPDLTADFMVGYDPEQDYLYVAILVHDESHVTMNHSQANLGWETDVTEIYIDGLHAERDHPWYEREGLDRNAAMQYVGTAGDRGAYECDVLNQKGHNPFVCNSEPEKVGVQLKALRTGDQITYEWALRVYDFYPQRSPLRPGRRIGFDAIVVDMDLNDGKMTDRAAWVPFGKRGGNKFNNASSMADLVFVSQEQSFGSIRGQLPEVDRGGSRAGIVIEAWAGALPAGEAHTDPEGNFSLTLPEGRYMLRPQPDQWVKPFRLEVEVEPDGRHELKI